MAKPKTITTEDILSSIYQNKLTVTQESLSKIKNDVWASNDKIDLECSIHGLNSVKIHHLINGSWCRGCGENKAKNIVSKRIGEVISKFENMHENKYDYSLIEKSYKNTITKVPIICKEHGVFWQKPFKHYGGQGCQKCYWSTQVFRGAEDYKGKITNLYYAKINNYYKIGISLQQKSIDRFKKDMSNGVEIKIIKNWLFSDGFLAFKNEEAILKKYSDYRLWDIDILNSGNTEIFSRDVLGLDYE